MVLLFVVVCLIIAFLVFLMFVILKKTVRIVNSQTKSYFVNKLQGYDDLIRDKESKLSEIDELIEKNVNPNNRRGIAQLAERRSPKPKVGGSIPSAPATS